MKRPLIIFAAIVSCLLAVPAVSYAQNTITCQSNNNRQSYCRIPDPRARVDLVKQLSRAPCIQGQTWGNDNQGIWVDRGCGATFRIGSYNGGPPPWWSSPGGRPPSGIRSGACFFTNYNFAGNYFCLQRGQRTNTPGGFNNSISSIQIFGGSRVTIYSYPNLTGKQTTVGRSVPDMRRLVTPGTNGGNWNDRISSMRVD
jgi:hypothetical protein